MKTADEVEFNAIGVKILWSDGTDCVFPYRNLRLQCMCAKCVEEMTGRKLLNVTSIPNDVIAVEYIRVGKYALQFLWSDGHQTGIYTFEMLSKMEKNDDSVLTN